LPKSEKGFPRNRRLLKPDDFSRVFNQGRRSSDRFFLVLGMLNQAGDTRLGMAVSKKNCRRAVDRNRIKRMIRESFRHHLESLAGLDLVVVARQGVATNENQYCLNSLQQHWRRIADRCVKQ
jgi:ribonuclease P protein component